MSNPHDITMSTEYMALQRHCNKLAEDNRMLLLRIDQLKRENERLKNEVEMLSIDLGMK